MIHDEKTTEIEIPTMKTGNIVRVDFTAQAKRESVAPAAPAVVRAMPLRPQNSHQWWRELDLGTPWMVRLLAVVAILILSLLIV